MHAHGPVPEPRAGREPHARDLGERAALLFVEVRVHVAAAAGLDRIDDPVEAITQNAQGVHAHGEHVRDRHR